MTRILGVICGAAIAIALCRMYEQGLLTEWPLVEQIAGVAVGRPTPITWSRG